MKATEYCFSNVFCSEVVHLPIVRGFIAGSPPLPINIMLDTGSSVNFVVNKVSRRLLNIGSNSSNNSKPMNVIEENVTVAINSLEGQQTMKTEIVGFRLTRPDDKVVKAFVVEKIHSYPRLNVSSKVASQYNLDGPYPRPKGEVDLLLGVVDTFRLLSGEHVTISNSLILLPTCYGYVPSGIQNLENFENVFQVDHAGFVTSTEALTKAMEKMWTMEKLPLDETPSSLTKDEQIAVESIKEKMHFDAKTNRFVTGLLWRDKPDLINNYPSAKARLDNLLSKLRENPIMKKAYVDAMNEYINMNVVERVTDLNITDLVRRDVYFLPHRAVYDEARLSTKCRIVFDASAKSGNKRSLNDNLVCGPALQLSILAIEVRFRTKRFVLIGDIGKMFLQIKIREEDRDYLRFLWKDPDSKGPPEVWRWNSLIFGAADSPFQAIKAVKTLVADRLKEPGLTELDHKVCEILDQNTYVDDLTITADSCEEAFQLYKGVTSLLARANFQVKKWASNSPELLKRLDQNALAPTEAVREVDLHASEENIISSDTTTLGIQWDPSRDLIHYSKCSKMAEENKNTMVSVASLLAKPFDPLGLLSPFILQARNILKQCHLLKMKWTDRLSEQLQKDWLTWVDQLQYLQEVQYERYVPLGSSTRIVIFSDASEKGYGAVAYCHTQNPNGIWKSSILCARSRVAPNNRMLTIPKKELAACVVAAELAQFLHEELGIEKERIHLFSDSMICLFQLTKPLNVLTPFVSNRVEKIRNGGFTFQYVNTKENPADICSRGCDLLDLNQDLWRYGPTWLTLPVENWPKGEVDFSNIDKSEGFRKTHIFSFHIDALTTPLSHPVNKPKKVGDKKVWPTVGELLGIGKTDRVPFEEYYSSYKMILQRTSWIFFAVRKWRSLLNHNKSETRQLIQPGQIDKQSALDFWIKITQKSAYSEEITKLENGAFIARSSKILQFNPFLDDKGILRVGGRLAYSNLSFEEKHPILLPKGHAFVRMIILHFHQENMHSGVDQTHFFLREKYWIVQARQLIRSLLSKCVKCRRITSRAMHPIMGNMPKGRTQLSHIEPPWTHVGVDLTGAIQLKKVGRRTVTPEQAYIVLYTCMATRSIYLDLMLTNKTEDFLLSFKRLCGDVGTPQYLYSDQAGYFSRAKEELEESFENLNACMKDLQEKGQIKWRMNASKAPHEAGVWERLVKTTKQTLLRVCRNSLFNYVEFLTILKETQALINDRPLVAASEDAIDVITPSMLTGGKKLKPFREYFGDSELPGKTYAKQRWQERSSQMDHLYDVWRKQYRDSLQRRAKWFTKQPNIRIGDLVVVHEEKVKRGYWKLARVIEILPSRDGSVRKVKISIPRFKDNGKAAAPLILERSVRQLCPLELTREEEEENESETQRRPVVPLSQDDSIDEENSEETSIEEIED